MRLQRKHARVCLHVYSSRDGYCLSVRLLRQSHCIRRTNESGCYDCGPSFDIVRLTGYRYIAQDRPKRYGAHQRSRSFCQRTLHRLVYRCSARARYGRHRAGLSQLKGRCISEKRSLSGPTMRNLWITTLVCPVCWPSRKGARHEWNHLSRWSRRCHRHHPVVLRSTLGYVHCGRHTPDYASQSNLSHCVPATGSQFCVAR